MNDLNLIRFAALLHDIGKFWQGTGELHDKRYNHLTLEDYGKHGAHAKWSASFIVNYLPKEFQNCEPLVLYHHNPKDYNLKTISLADWLSSGERIGLPEGEEKGKRMKTPQMSIFSKIDIEKGKPSAQYHPVKQLKLDKKIIFPNPLDLKKKTENWLRSDYEKAWKGFVREVERIKTITDFDAYFKTLYYLLQKYTWCVPSAVYTSEPDVSLFDHLKTTCAIAECLYKSGIGEEDLDNLISGIEKSWKRKELNEEEEMALNDDKFILIGGDISGIQKFIYSITSKGAAKGLKGRSFYLELLNETIAKFILRELNLPITNLLYCAGGHFYILSPSNVDLEKIRKDVAEKLLDIHDGELYLAIDQIPLSAKDFQREKFGNKWKEVSEKLGERKKLKFSEILDTKYNDLFGPIGEGKETCHVCTRESKYKLIPDKDNPDIKKCSLCNSFEALAGEIARAIYIAEIVGSKGGETPKGTWEWAISKFGMNYKFLERIEDAKHVKARHIAIYKLNDTDFIENISIATEASSPISFGFKFSIKSIPFVKKEIPDIEGKIYTKKEIKDFDEIANDANGIKKWAVLRADVDNLGKIFSKGLGENRTISRISTLSSMFSLFFSGWINEICKEYKDKVYGIYSGGDDLFIVGSWDIIPDLSKDIYNDFREYTCQNTNITLSTSISIAPSKKYPLYKVAELAGKALEDQSKERAGRDAITFLDKPMKWEKFNDGVTELKEKLIELIGAGVSRGALLQKLYSVYQEFDKQRKKRGETLAKYDDRYGRWRWLLAWVIKRTKVPKENEDLLKKVEKLIRDNIKYSRVAIRWVEFITRKEEVK